MFDSVFDRAKSITLLSSGFLFVASLGGFAAQEAPKGAPYIGVISGNDVKIRTGGSKNHLAFASIKLGQRVLVDREVNGWCKVFLPRWIPVFIHKDYVDVRGAKAIVKAGELNVRVAPQKQHADEVVGTLARGSEIEVIGKEGDWLKVAPPPGTFGFVSKQYLSRERDVAPNEVSGQLALLKEGAEPTAAIARKSRGTEKVVPSASPAEARLISVSLKKADDLYQEIRGRDAVERDYSPVRTIYQELIQSSEDRSEIAAAEKALKFLDEQEERDKALVDAQHSVAEADKKNQEIKELARQRISGRVSPIDADPYLARGWVSGMGRFSGQQGTHRLLKGSQVLYYLQSEEGSTVPLDSYLNRRVGVKGVVRELDPKYGANLIIVKEIVVLSDR